MRVAGRASRPPPRKQAIRRPGQHQLSRDRRDPPPGGRRGQMLRQPRREIAPQVVEIHPQIAQLAERNAERRPTTPGRNRAPMARAPGGSGVGTGSVSGPAIYARRPRGQIRSVQPSGNTSVGGAPSAGTTRVHRRASAPPRPAGAAHERQDTA